MRLVLAAAAKALQQLCSWAGSSQLAMQQSASIRTALLTEAAQMLLQSVKTHCSVTGTSLLVVVSVTV